MHPNWTLTREIKREFIFVSSVRFFTLVNTTTPFTRITSVCTWLLLINCIFIKCQVVSKGFSGSFTGAAQVFPLQTWPITLELLSFPSTLMRRWGKEICWRLQWQFLSSDWVKVSKLASAESMMIAETSVVMPWFLSSRLVNKRTICLKRSV